MNDYVIETKQVTKSYGSFLALDHVNIHVKRGSIYGLVGDNGAGKSTLLKLLAGHIYPTEGEVQLFGKYEEKDLEHSRKKIGCMVEQPGFFPNMTVEQMLKYYCIQKGIPDRKKVDEIITLTGISEKRNNKCKKLSLGQKQRLALAIAMIGEPQLLVLDEPINGLDPSGIVEFRNLLHSLNEEKNITILLSSHILSELQQIATVYGFLSKGILIEEISAQALHEKCSDCIEITLSDVEKYSVLLEKNYSKETYKVLPENNIRIYRPKAQAEAYSKLAYENGIYITGMRTIQSSLENYYMELKKRGTEK
ncbi:ABC transporter ATP-binding protein [Clostridium polynesiense]|uniref:ABC transporter ATP-binding protein n=1 Tax=Clostridium polynesiense TaxID=1325933 RepID=UPI00058BBA22|nr:ABC transporter ATP-binding protein [Clostridium polynesiense]